MRKYLNPLCDTTIALTFYLLCHNIVTSWTFIKACSSSSCSNNLRRLVGSIPNLKVRHVTMTAEGRVKAGLFGLGGLTFILFLCSQLDWKVSPTKWVEIIFEYAFFAASFSLFFARYFS